ncbi:hypothetical protein [Phaeovulum sp. W22_SRMD_FR3]|uniref:hypothetical protein n=1 Tax=Phaeovulum sp. W22_SRMD_FR3 TaxID=3240274 RepID=UPI003F97BFE5
MTKLSKLITTTALLGLTALPVAALDLSAGTNLSLGDKDAAVSAQAELGTTADAQNGADAQNAETGAAAGTGAPAGTDLAQSDTGMSGEATVPEASTQGTLTTAAKGDVVLSADDAVIGTVDQVVPGPEGTQTLLVTLEPEVGAETEAARFSVNVTTDAAVDGKVKLAMNKADLLGELSARAAGTSDG